LEAPVYTLLLKVKSCDLAYFSKIRSEKKRVLCEAEDPLKAFVKVWDHMPDPPCMFNIKTQNWCRTKSAICMRNDRPGKLSPELQLVGGSQGH
jgi:hypothetical protein